MGSCAGSRPGRITPGGNLETGALPGRGLAVPSAGNAPTATWGLAIEEVLDLVDLSGPASRRISAFSLRMRQRLGLASALLGDPQILILDEPANGLDPDGIRWLRGLAGEGRTIFVSSHVLAEAAQTVDHVVVISRDRLVTQSPLADLTAQGAPIVRIRTPNPAGLQAGRENRLSGAVAGEKHEPSQSAADRQVDQAWRHSCRSGRSDERAMHRVLAQPAAQ